MNMAIRKHEAGAPLPAGSMTACTWDWWRAETLMPSNRVPPRALGVSRVYSPSGRFLKPYRPPRELIAVSSAPVASFRSRIVTFSRGEECASVRRPESDPVASCAGALKGRRTPATNRVTSARDFLSRWTPMQTQLRSSLGPTPELVSRWKGESGASTKPKREKPLNPAAFSLQ